MILALVGLSVCIFLQIKMMIQIPVNKRKIQSTYYNLGAFFLSVVIVTMTLIFIGEYDNDEATRERALLRQVAISQIDVYEKQGSFGQKVDLINERKSLFGEDFTVENGNFGEASYLRTNRCEMVVTPGQQFGPLCGGRRSRE